MFDKYPHRSLNHNGTNRFPLIAANGSKNQIQEIAANGDGLDLTGNNIVGVVDITDSGNVSVGGTLTYEDVTNVDSVGLITCQELVSELRPVVLM